MTYTVILAWKDKNLLLFDDWHPSLTWTEYILVPYNDIFPLIYINSFDIIRNLKFWRPWIGTQFSFDSFYIEVFFSVVLGCNPSFFSLRQMETKSYTLKNRVLVDTNFVPCTISNDVLIMSRKRTERTEGQNDHPIFPHSLNSFNRVILQS